MSDANMIYESRMSVFESADFRQLAARLVGCQPAQPWLGRQSRGKEKLASRNTERQQRIWARQAS